MTRKATGTAPSSGLAAATSGRIAMIDIDGAARGNPGPAGLGVVIRDAQGRVVRQFYKFIGETTNNVAEYLALVYALQEALMLKFDAVTVRTDSELLSKQFAGEYKVRDGSLRVWYDQVMHLRSAFRSLSVQAIGREQNAVADRLANEAVEQRFDTGVKYQSLE